MTVICQWARASLVLAGMALLLLSGGQAVEPADPRGVIIEEVRNSSPVFHVRVVPDRPDGTYKGGEELKLTVRSDAEGYLYLFYATAEKKVLLLFPNYVQKDNKIPAAKTVNVPAPDAKFRLRVGPPYGKEVLLALVTRQPLKVPGLEIENLVEKEVTEIDLAKLKEANTALLKGPAGEWAEHSIQLTTVDPKSPAPVARTEKRVALCVGVGKYKSPVINDVPVCARGARDMATLLRDRCGLSEDAILVTDEKATRANLQEQISRKLPAMTRPGDTVILFWNGHGMPFPTLDGKIEHYLMLHDTDIPNLPAKPTPDDVEKLLRSVNDTALSSAVLPRWLQELEGRRIVLLVEACFSGGLHEKTRKVLPAPRAVEAADEPFLGGLLRRSRALDQKELALIASSTATQTSAIRNQKDYGVFTFFLKGTLQEGDGALTITDSFERVRKPLREFIPGWRKELQEKFAKAQKEIEEALRTEKDEKKIQELKRVQAQMLEEQESLKMFDQTPVLVDDITPPFQLRPTRGK